MLRKGTIIQFIQMNNFTGEKVKYQGEIMGHAGAVKKMWPIECGEIINPVYLVRREDPFGNLFHHMVFPEEIFSKKQEKNPGDYGHLLKYLRKNQAYKAGIRKEKEKKRRENYFK